MTQLLLRDLSAGDLLGPPSGSDRTASDAPSFAVSRLEFAFVADMACFEALEADWNGLFAAAGRPSQAFQTFNWCWHWCRHYLARGSRKGPSLAVVTARLDGRLVLVLPLAVERTAGVRGLVWLGEPVSQYGDILAAPVAANVAAMLAAWNFAVANARADVAHLRKVRADAVAAPLLAQLGASITASEEAPYLDLSREASFEGWEERRQPKARKNRKRQARRLSDTGEVRFVRHSGTPVATALARHSIVLKRATLGAKGAISPALADDRFEEFFADATGSPERPAGATVHALDCNGEAVALKVMIDNASTRLLHIAVFDPRFEKFGAGAVLLENVIRESIADGCQTLDLLAPRHGYKMDFADGVVLVHDHALALSMAGTLYARGYLALRRHLKGMIEALPAPVRRRIARLV